MSLDFMGGYGSGSKLAFTGDPTLVNMKRARAKQYENQTSDREEYEEAKRRYENRIEDLEKNLEDVDNDRQSDIMKMASLKRQVRELKEEGHIVINVNLNSRESIDRAKRIINAIDG